MKDFSSADFDTIQNEWLNKFRQSLEKVYEENKKDDVFGWEKVFFNFNEKGENHE